MPRYIATRLLAAVAMAVLASLVVFLISALVPGDPVLAQLGDIAASNPATVLEWRAKWGLDLPLWERYGIFLNGLVHGDLGTSIATRRPVLEDIVQYAPATLELATVSFLLTLLVGIPLGIAAAVWRDSWVDSLARAVSLLQKKGVPFQEIDAPHGTAQRQEARARSGQTTVPQVFIDGRHVGGCDDLVALDRRGELATLLAGTR